MKNRRKNIITAIIVVAVFLIQLVRGLSIPKNEAGFIPSGAMNEPSAVLFSAALAGVLAYILLQILLWVYSKISKKR